MSKVLREHDILPGDIRTYHYRQSKILKKIKEKKNENPKESKNRIS